MDAERPVYALNLFDFADRLDGPRSLPRGDTA
jgi:hypothetical protein